MSLHSLINNSLTDKGTTHAYLELYEEILINRKTTAKNVLEIGIGDFTEKNGGSIKLWRDYFTNATIYALDILSMNRIIDELKNDEKVILYAETDAYNKEFVEKEFVVKNLKFDFMLDDGPHSLDSMIWFIQLYLPLLADDGLLVIEDIPSWEWIEIIANEVPDDVKQYINTYDLRSVKHRYDDIVFTIDKSK